MVEVRRGFGKSGISCRSKGGVGRKEGAVYTRQKETGRIGRKRQDSYKKNRGRGEGG